MTTLLRRLPVALVAAALLGFIVYALWPRPVNVDMAEVVRGPLEVTVDEDGVTRIKEKYVVSAPLAGRMARVTLKEGDPVTAGETVLAAIYATPPSLLDPRTRAEAEARIRAAEAALDRARAEVAATSAAYELAQSELARVRAAAERQAATEKELEQAVAAEMMRRQELRAAEFARDIATFEVELAKAALMHADEEQPDVRFEIHAPVSGRVLRVLQESAAVVQPGTPLIEVGDPSDLEIVVDVLSRDAVAIRPGAPVIIEQWGGDQPLHGRVRVIEPAAFLKISALGVEEQRVNVIVDFTDLPAPGNDEGDGEGDGDPAASHSGLGDAYRIEARILVWSEPDVLKVPTGALFRHAESWAVYVVEDGKARRRDVTLGRRSGTEAQVVSGLSAGERVILYPSDQVSDGASVAPRAR